MHKSVFMTINLTCKIKLKRKKEKKTNKNALHALKLFFDF